MCKNEKAGFGERERFNDDEDATKGRSGWGSTDAEGEAANISTWFLQTVAGGVGETLVIFNLILTTPPPPTRV